eukprot:CAMPEP_0170418550 /NCGR_PEP_ID=MMETSP0117_2-20130122/34319_1 /TAXON_ID=400756 /ORGANISM="Durinskia baltica, Strain CSIRO CS-38" /LENGTH=150 /DNA_ID=CAMNT_0010676829 /DNA_START=106 /DNA_END=554 /DNA_ORIENTATION=-
MDPDECELVDIIAEACLGCRLPNDAIAEIEQPQEQAIHLFEAFAFDLLRRHPLGAGALGVQLKNKLVRKEQAGKDKRFEKVPLETLNIELQDIEMHMAEVPHCVRHRLEHQAAALQEHVAFVDLRALGTDAPFVKYERLVPHTFTVRLDR